MNLKILIGLTFLFFSTQLHAYSYTLSSAGDKDVSCSETTVEYPYFYGNAYCYAHGELISRYFDFNITRQVTIGENIFVNGQWDYATCTTNLPFQGVHQETVVSCEKSPRASIIKNYVQESYDELTDTAYYTIGVAVATFQYSDSDGYVTNVEKWVNGNEIEAQHVEIHEPTHFRIRVTDNDGNVTETSATMIPPNMQACVRGGMLVLCDQIF